MAYDTVSALHTCQMRRCKTEIFRMLP